MTMLIKTRSTQNHGRCNDNSGVRDTNCAMQRTSRISISISIHPSARPPPDTAHHKTPTIGFEVLDTGHAIIFAFLS